jgi:hypothetical protein
LVGFIEAEREKRQWKMRFGEQWRGTLLVILNIKDVTGDIGRTCTKKERVNRAAICAGAGLLFPCGRSRDRGRYIERSHRSFYTRHTRWKFIRKLFGVEDD